MIPGLVQELDENVDENLELSCKLIKKVATPLPNFYKGRVVQIMNISALLKRNYTAITVLHLVPILTLQIYSETLISVPE